MTEGRTPVDPSECLRCGAPLESMGTRELRVGGTTGGWKLVFGELAELGEGLIDLEFLVCPRCRKVELRAPSTR